MAKKKKKEPPAELPPEIISLLKEKLTQAQKRQILLYVKPDEAEALDPLEKLATDLKKAGDMLTKDEARFIVDYYYIAQEDRKRGYNQEKALEKNGEPHGVISWIAGTALRTEEDIKAVLGIWASKYISGRWAQSIRGIGPVISAGLLAHLDVEKAPTVGHIWRFAGLDPTLKWEKGEKRPFNAGLKCLCFKIGESFVKQSNNKDDIYGHVYAKRKLLEIERNEAGAFADQAKDKLVKFNIRKTTDAYAWYAGCLTPEKARILREGIEAEEKEEQEEGDAPEIPGGAEKKKKKNTKMAGAALKMAGEPGSGIPMLPPAHIHARARRYAVKLFLSHFHEAMWREKHGGIKDLPKPYIFTDQAKKMGLGDHADFISMPDPEGIFKEQK